MYHDFGNHTQRSSINYTYKASELIAKVQEKLSKVIAEEETARSHLRELFENRRAPGDKSVETLQSKVDRLGALVEELQVYAHEFRRTPEKEIVLGLGDIAFFGLI